MNNDPKDSAKDLLDAAGNVVKAPLNIIVDTLKGDPAEGVDKAVDNISNAVDNIGDAISDFFDF